MLSSKVLSKPRCPACQTTLDGATSVEVDAKPESGDCSVCAYCGLILVFTEDLQLRQMTATEYEALTPRMQTLMATISKEIRKIERGVK